ncbi:uncharacterized protein PRCAT00000782001 [Priceomyces carsonii]|uniref:uncharacterized protein n=1 Tax=Priceomyces carsonii TaxID=28549 RepID=UPI002ED9F626|nr:unnamed protein product [Priceomyces carsonii]
MLSSKKLIGTPLRRGEGNGPTRGQEFTPIGGKLNFAVDKNNAFHVEQPNVRGKRALFIPIKEDTKASRRSVLDSSFDNTIDNFDNTLGSLHLPLRPSNYFNKADTGVNLDINKNGSVSHLKSLHPLEDHDLIGNGLPSIREQETRFRRIETENYNLKIKLATLQRYIDQTPEENRELLSENISLKQQLFASSEEADRLRQLNRDLTKLVDKENYSDPNELENAVLKAKSEYKDLLRERDTQIRDNEAHIKRLQELVESNRRNADEIDAHGSAENMSLKRTIESLRGDLRTFESENEELKKVTASLNDEIEKFIEDKRSLNETTDSLKRQNSNHKYELRSLNELIDNLKYDLSNSESERKALESKFKTHVEKLNVDLDEARNELSRWKKKTNALNDDRDYIKELNSKVSEYEEKYGTIKSKSLESELKIDMLSNENQKLERKLHRVEEDLKEKEKEEYSLRSQISALIKKGRSFESATVLESQIEDLKNSESKLISQNKSLKSEIDELRDQLYQNNVGTSSQATKLKEELDENRNRIEYYEKEYDSLQNVLSSVKSKADALERELKEKNRIVSELKLEINSKIPDSSALLELENATKRRLEVERLAIERENTALEAEVSRLKFEIQRLKQESDLRSTELYKDSHLGTEYHSLLIENRELQSKLRDFNSNRQEEESRMEQRIKDIELKYLTEISSKKLAIQQLESQVFHLNQVQDEKTKLIKQNSNQDSKIKKLEFDIENLTREYDSEVNYYRQKMSLLESQNVNRERSESSIVMLLEKQLEDSKKIRDDLNLKLSSSMSKADDLNKKASDLENKNDELQSLISKIESNVKFLKAENERLDIKGRRSLEEIKTLSKYNSNLVEKIENLRRKEFFSKDELNTRFSKIDLNSNKGEVNLLGNELKYYKARLHDFNLRANDLEFMYSFIITSIENSNDLIKKDLKKLVGVGFYPNHSLHQRSKKKLTFSIVAQFVLSLIRMKRRSSKANLRKLKLFELKNEIENDKLLLIS